MAFFPEDHRAFGLDNLEDTAFCFVALVLGMASVLWVHSFDLEDHIASVVGRDACLAYVGAQDLCDKDY